jgi:CRP-like cAMP-binding protein
MMTGSEIIGRDRAPAITSHDDVRVTRLYAATERAGERDAADEGNELLRRIAREHPACYETLADAMTVVPLRVDAPIGHADGSLDHVYFPQSGVLSAVIEMADGRRVATTIVGNEGMIGLAVYLGARGMEAVHHTQVPGVAKRLSADVFRRAFSADQRAAEILQSYIRYITCQMARSAACNALHSIAQRSARWLLMVRDRTGTDTFPLTQQFLAAMLGVRRTGVTEAAGDLRRAGLIHYRRGKVTVQDASGLSLAACECYLMDRIDRQQMLT